MVDRSPAPSVPACPPGGRRRALLLSLAALLVASGARGQAPLAGPIFEFSFSNPGARSMGFGGAFVALADDATAAFANPAGLVQLTRPEVSLEGRLWSYSTPYTRGGRLVGTPTGIGLDRSARLRREVDERTLTGPSFLSVVYPGKRWALAFYRHQLAEFESQSATQGLFGPGSSCCRERYPDVRIGTELSIAGHGLSASYAVNERLWLGGTLVWFDGLWNLRGESFFPDDDAPESEFLEGSYLPERMFIRTEIEMDDTDWSGTFGLLWSFAERWRLGAVFRDAPNFVFLVRSWAGPAAARLGVTPGELLTGQFSRIVFPDVFGLGLSWRSAGGRLTLAFEWDNIAYSTILDNQNPELGVAGLRLDDGTEFHVGAEVVFLRTRPLIGVRFGAWLDPDHRTSFVGEDVYRRSLLPKGDNEAHFTAGLGAAFERFQIDLGIDYSEPLTTASISAIYSF